jgi:hypothetical protein
MLEIISDMDATVKTTDPDLRSLDVSSYRFSPSRIEPSTPRLIYRPIWLPMALAALLAIAPKILAVSDSGSSDRPGAQVLPLPRSALLPFDVSTSRRQTNGILQLRANL